MVIYLMDSEISYIKGMNLGVGFNTATYDVHCASPLDHVIETRKVLREQKQEALFRIGLVSSTKSISEQLNMSGKASFNDGSFSSSVKFTLDNMFNENNFAVYLIVQVDVINKQTLLDVSKIKFNSEAENLYIEENKKFVEQYGDSFVYGLVTKREFIGILEFEASSISESRELKATLTAKLNGGRFSKKLKDEFQLALKEITSSYRMKATVFHEGNTGESHELPPQQLVTDALNFPKKVEGDFESPSYAFVIPYSQFLRK